jgi:hypothetical protein
VVVALSGGEVMTRPTVTVVLPVLDEAPSVVACIDEARTGLAAADLRGEVLVIDNGSRDGSAALARAAGARVVREPVEGYGAALRRGIAEATGDIVVMADADGTYDLAHLGTLVEPIARGDADIVVGSRLRNAARSSMPFLHRFVGTPVLSFLVRRAGRQLRIRDSQSGFRAIRTDAARRLALKATGMEFASEMLIRASQDGLVVIEHDLPYRPRIGESKLRTMRDGFRHLLLIVMLAPHLVLFWPGVAMLASGAALAAMSIANPLGFNLGPLRWQPIFFGPILIVLGGMGTVAGAVLANQSPLIRPDVARHFGFVDDRRFARRCVAAGSAVLAAGLGIDLVLFVVWITQETSPARALAFAGVAQALIIGGAGLAGFGITQTMIKRRDSYRDRDGDIDVTELGVLGSTAPPRS